MNGGFSVPPSGIAVAAFVLSAASVALVRRHAVQRGLLDVPNERSSHTVPTARGGGLGVVLVIAALWASVLSAWTRQPGLDVVICLAALLVVAAVGWIDDKRGVSVRTRLGVHLAAGAAVAYFETRTGQPWLVSAWWLFWVVSAINVVNFMDGIDGLVASQSLIAALWIAQVGPPGGVARPFALAIAGAAAGFLVWNWPPARIFLGDVGSGALGFALVFTGALAIWERGTEFHRVFLPLYPLFLDATVTILRRARSGERITTAHRSHLYQRLANGGWGHARVTLLYAMAALAGVAVAAVGSSTAGWPLTLAYAAIILALGWALDRRVGGHALRASDRAV